MSNNLNRCHSVDLEKPTDDEDGSDSFVDKLLAQVLKNLKVSEFEAALQQQSHSIWYRSVRANQRVVGCMWFAQPTIS